MERVIKRDGRIEEVDFNKILERITSLTYGLSNHVSASKVAKKVVEGIFDLVLTEQLDDLATKIAASLNVNHPDFGLLAGRISASNLQKKCPTKFSESMSMLYNNTVNGVHSPILCENFYEYVMANHDKLDAMVFPSRDFCFSIFSMETLKKSYLLKSGSVICETPQYLYMRVAVFLNMEQGLEAIEETYEAFSSKKYTHASPTLFNAGTNSPQMASCFLQKLDDDSIGGIYKTLSDTAQISRWAGGIGLSMHELRSNGSYIAGSNGRADGIVPALRVFNETAVYVNQAGRRKGSFAVYLEPHHADIEDFLQLRLPGGSEERRTRDLFTALWASDLFFERVKKNESWSLFDPKTAPGLNKVYGDKYVSLYEQYESEGRAVKSLPAQRLWSMIVQSVTETGTPYLSNKDQVNRMSNQRNLGTIESSNLCCEIEQYSSKEETAVCNLASINVSAFVLDDENTVDYEGLAQTSALAVRNLNHVIDKSFYPTPESKLSNERHRPLGLGVSGLADLFFILGVDFDSHEAKVINKNVFEAIYFGAVNESVRLASLHGPYSSFKGSPASFGMLQFDLWNSSSENPGISEELRLELKSTLGWDDRWKYLKLTLKEFGMRNSLLTAVMPTASSASIMGVNECVEPITANVYTRAVLSGEFTIMNRHLVEALDKIGLWNDEMSQQIMKNDGSVQNIEGIPTELKNRFKTVWEVSQKHLIDMSFQRSPFVDQSQSLNLFLKNITTQRYTSMLFYAWARRLKTMQYYLRSQAVTSTVKFTLNNTPEQNQECLSCSA